MQNRGGEHAKTARPHAALWLFYLYFRPAAFFRTFIVDHLKITTVICAWALGISSAIDRFERRAAAGHPVSFLNRWDMYFAYALGAGAIGAILFYALGGWWYRRRLIWSGATRPDPVVSRRVYIYSSTVTSLPAVLTAIWESGTYNTPLEALNAAGTWWHVAIMALPFWSVAVSFVGVRTVFGVRGVRPTIWFLVLPCVVYAIAIGTVLLTTLLTSQPPRVSSPNVYSQAGVSMSLPGDWQVDASDPDYELGAYLPVAMPQDATLIVQIETTDREPNELATETVKFMAQNLGDASPELTRFSRWGAFQGAGSEVSVPVGNGLATIRVFATRLPDGRVMIAQEIFAANERTSLRPGYDLVANSIRVEPEPTQSP